jgi:GGDEF domain-containing protein
LFHLPIVFFSSMSNPEEIQHGLAQGADDFIPKPIDFAQIVHRVNSLVNASARASYTDIITGLPDAEETRRRVQLRITRGDRFALIYVELLGLRKLTLDAGAEARDKALRHLGRALRLAAEATSDAEAFVGHMGGGFFLCLLPPDHSDSYATKLLKSWRKHQPGLRENLGLKERATDGPGDFLDLMICTTARESRDTCSALDLLDTLTRIRRSVADEVGGIHADRRHGTAAQEAPGGRAGV